LKRGIYNDMQIPFYHINSFTRSAFSGNPAGVCLLEEFLPDDVLLNIASQNKLSQTAYIVRHHSSKSDFDLRWFTPVTEDDLCGHATLAAAFVLNHIGGAGWPVRFHTRSGILEVVKQPNTFVMDFPAWPPQPCDVPEELLPALGLHNAEVCRTRDYLVFVETPEQVKNMNPDFRALKKLENGLGGVIVTAPGEGKTDYVSRFFAPAAGIDEDPATGSIQCTLAPYWAERLGKKKFVTKQLSLRGGEMMVELAGERIKITGKARLYCRGVIEL
jgi:PhzF family phenazine biosynthesis protein